MATMNAEMYDALLTAGAGEEKARKAAEQLAALNERFGKVEQNATDLSSRMEARFTKVEADLSLLKWMVGFVLAGVAALVVRGLF